MKTKTTEKAKKDNQCCICHMDDERINVHVEGADGQFRCFCPNHLIMDLDKVFEIKPFRAIDDASLKEDECYRITTGNHSFTLNTQHLIDFVCLCLDDLSYMNLMNKVEKEYGGEFEYYLHDDFYTEDGLACQPNYEIAMGYYIKQRKMVTDIRRLISMKLLDTLDDLHYTLLSNGWYNGKELDKTFESFEDAISEVK